MLRVTYFESFVPVLVTGADRIAFMQGQLTADLRKLTPTQAVYGACCSAQGRVQAVITVIERAEGMALLVPSGFAEALLARFRKATLASKVNFELAPWVIAPLFGGDAKGGGLPTVPGACHADGEVTWLRFWGSEERYLIVAPTSAVQVLAAPTSELAAAWRRSDVRSGLPWIHAATRNSFVPQTINLDLLGGVSFDKGCYVGQEVVARARRAGVPRRMFAFSAACAPPPPGVDVLSDGVVVGAVVEATRAGRGSCILATVDLDQAAGALWLRDIDHSELTLESLPYAVPRARQTLGAERTKA